MDKYFQKSLSKSRSSSPSIRKLPNKKNSKKTEYLIQSESDDSDLNLDKRPSSSLGSNYMEQINQVQATDQLDELYLIKETLT